MLVECRDRNEMHMANDGSLNEFYIKISCTCATLHKDGRPASPSLSGFVRAYEETQECRVVMSVMLPR